MISAIDAAAGDGARARGLGLRALVVLLAVPFVAPLAYLVVRNAEEGGFASTLADDALLAPLGRSLLLATSVALAAAVVGTAAAWLVTRTDLPGRRVIRLLLPLPLVLPSFIGAFALIAAFAPGGLIERALGVSGLPEVRGFWWAFGVLTLLTYPYVYLPAAARLRQLPPAVEESARLLGRRPAAVFATVVLPQARAAIAAGALLVFLYVIADFGAVQLLRYDTLTRAIYANYLLDPEVAVALSLALGLLAIVVVVAQRRVAGGTRQDARREGRALTVALGRWRVAALAFVGALLGLALAAPVAVLVYWTVRGVEAGSSRANSLVADPARLVEPALNTSVASVAAALVAVAVGAAGRVPHGPPPQPGRRRGGRAGDRRLRPARPGDRARARILDAARARPDRRALPDPPAAGGRLRPPLRGPRPGPRAGRGLGRAPAPGRRRPHPGAGPPLAAWRRSTCR